MSFITAWQFPSSRSPIWLLGYCFLFLSFGGKEKKNPLQRFIHIIGKDYSLSMWLTHRKEDVQTNSLPD